MKKQFKDLEIGDDIYSFNFDDSVEIYKIVNISYNMKTDDMKIEFKSFKNQNTYTHTIDSENIYKCKLKHLNSFLFSNHSEIIQHINDKIEYIRKEKSKIMSNCISEFIRKQNPSDSNLQKFVTNNFWDLV